MENNNQPSRRPERPRSFSFACSGWLKTYMFGVSKALQELGLDTDAVMLGSSGGSLAALGLCLSCDFDAMMRGIVHELAPSARSSIRNAFRIRGYLLEAFNRWGNFHKYEELNATKRCVVVYSSISKWRSRRKSTVSSIEDLKQACLASCCAPPIAGFPFRFHGEWVMDGGLMDFQPVLDEHTVTISPLYCMQADIKPSQYVPLWWAVYPPEPEQIEWLYNLGKHDAYVFARKLGYAAEVTLVPPKPLESNPWRTSLGRFLGYRSMEYRLLDCLFMIAVVSLWKPLAFGLLYMELWLRAVLCGADAAACAFATAGQWTKTAVFAVGFSLLGLSIVAPSCIYQLFGALMCILLYSYSSCGRLELSLASGKFNNCMTCVQIALSMSLFLRSIPYFGSAVPVKKHNFLVKYSLVYRLINHFV
jgi:hypothetical protein